MSREKRILRVITKGQTLEKENRYTHAKKRGAQTEGGNREIERLATENKC